MTGLKFALFGAANYYCTTLAIWAGHWFSHRRYSPTHEFHVGGHHALYPNSKSSLSSRFLYGTGRHDSLFALLPSLVLQASIIVAGCDGWQRWLLLLETFVIAGMSSWLHTQFHIGRTFLARYSWFRSARREHWAHHDDDVNFMVADLFWDKIFRTYKPGLTVRRDA